jgi:streptogramin lyase
MSRWGLVRCIRALRPVTAGVVFCIALACCSAPASSLPLKLFSAPFPRSCPPGQIVYGPLESIWFLLRACEGIRGEQTPSGVGRLPLGGPSALLVRRLNKTPESLALGWEGDLWFTERPYEESEGAPGIGRLTPAGQLTEFPTPVEPNLVFPQEPVSHEQPGQISAGPESDLWFTAKGLHSDVLSRITPAGALSQFPPQQEKIGSATQPKFDEVALGFATAANGNLWMAEDGGGAIGLIEPGGAIRQFQVAEGSFRGVDASGEGGSDPIVGTADGGVWLVEREGFTRLSASGAVLRRVPRVGYETGFWGYLAVTPDGALWVSEAQVPGVLKRITSTGQSGEIAFCNAEEKPEQMTVGPEGDLWFVSREGNFGRLDVAQLTGELERNGTQVQVCGATATPKALSATIACSTLHLSRLKLKGNVSLPSPCSYRATLTLLGSPGQVVGVGRFSGFALGEPTPQRMLLRPLVRALLKRRGRLSLRLTLWSGARVAASRMVTLRR